MKLYLLFGFLLLFAVLGYAASCTDIELSASNITVEIGQEAEKNFTLENHAEERFHIDFVDVYDRSENFRIESNGYDKIVYANGVASLGVKVKAYANAEADKERAYISLRGHFLNGSACTLEEHEETFYVNVIKAEEIDEIVTQSQLPKYNTYCNGFILSAPNTKTIDESGRIAFRIENNTPYRASVNFYGKGLVVEPSLLSVPNGFKSQDYEISVFATTSESVLYYEIETFDCMTRESTRVFSVEPQTTAPEQGNGEDAGNGTGNEKGNGTEGDNSLQAIVGTAFAVLGQNSVNLGLLIIVIIIAIYLVALLKR